MIAHLLLIDRIQVKLWRRLEVLVEVGLLSEGCVVGVVVIYLDAEGSRLGYLLDRCLDTGAVDLVAVRVKWLVVAVATTLRDVFTLVWVWIQHHEFLV